MSTDKNCEYCLIVEGNYFSEAEAEHALRDPFIEEWIEQTGNYRIHHLDDILLVPGVALSHLGVTMLEESVFEIAPLPAYRSLTEHKAKGIAEALRRQDMFDTISVEARGSYAAGTALDESSAEEISE